MEAARFFHSLLCIRRLQRGRYQRLALPPSAGIPLSQPTEFTPAPLACSLQPYLRLYSSSRHVTYCSACYLDRKKVGLMVSYRKYQTISSWGNFIIISNSSWILCMLQMSNELGNVFVIPSKVLQTSYEAVEQF